MQSMTLEDKQNVTYRRQRYKRRERKLEITPDPVMTEPEVEEANMGGNEGDKTNEEKDFAHLLLKSVQTCPKTLKEWAYEMAMATRVGESKGISNLEKGLAFRNTTYLSMQTCH